MMGSFKFGQESQVIKINFAIEKAVFKVLFVKSMSTYNDDIASVNILSKKMLLKLITVPLLYSFW